MKKIAYVPLHYGCDYLYWALRAVAPAVDEIHILYTAAPSYGVTTTAPCPDSEAALRACVSRFQATEHTPVVWHTGRWQSEGAHRDTIRTIARTCGADLVVAFDADEVWPIDDLKAALAQMEQGAHGTAGSVRVRFLHLWQSFGWACEDTSMPVRLLDIRYDWRDTWYLSPQARPVLHFGYAQRHELMRYKWLIHGHQSELRPAWMENKFFGWQPGVDDVHPTNLNFWTPRRLTPEETAQVAACVGDHPYYNRERIT